MKNFKRASALLLTFALVLGMFPAMVFATEETTPATVAAATTPVAGDKVLFADFGASQDAAWQDDLASKLSDGSKIVATWDAVSLYLVYATKGGAAATVNGKAAIVTAGDTYDVAKIGLAQLGIAPKDYKSYYNVDLTVGEATWEGFVALRSDDKSMVTKNGFTGTTGFTSGVLATAYNWVATDAALGAPQRVNYQAYLADGTSAFYAGSANGYVIDFNLDLTTMPVVSMDDETLAATAYRPLTTGLTFALYDPFSNGASVDAEGNALADAVNRNHVFFNIAKNESGLKLLTRGKDNKYLVTDLDDDLGTQIHVRAEAFYTAGVAKRGVTLKVYINDKLVVISQDARVANSCLGTTTSANRMGMLALVNNYDSKGDQSHASENIQAADITIRDVAISEVNGAAYEAKASAGSNVLIAPRDGDAVAGFNGGAFNGLGGLLSDGTSKVFAAWNARKLTLVYSTQNGAAATINGKTMTVVSGDTYDTAVISLDALGVDIQTSCVEILASFVVNGKSWDGFLYLDELTAAAANTSSAWTTTYALTTSEGKWLNGTANEFGLEDTVVYDLSLAVTSLPTQDPTGVKKLANTGAYANGLSFTMYDPYTKDTSENLPADVTLGMWTPVVFAKDASNKLYVAVLENTDVKYAYVDGITIDGTTAHNLDVRVEYSHASATSNVVVLKVYVNGVLIITSDNARDDVHLGSTPNPNRYGAKAASYTTGEAINVSINALQYVQTASEVEVVDSDVLIAPRDGNAVAAFIGGAFNGMGGLLSDGTSKVYAAWNADKLTLVYPTQNGAAATINGKAMTVLAGATYDVAVIALDALDLDVKTSCVEFLASFAVNGKTWDGIICLDELTAGANNTTTGSSNGWANVYSYDQAAGTQYTNAVEMARTANEFDLATNPTIVYDMNLSVTSLPTQAPAGLGKPSINGGYCGQGLTVAMGDPYTSNSSTLPEGTTATSQQWTPLVIAKDASGNLYIAIWENKAWKYEYIDGIVLDDTTAYNLDVRAEFSHASATSNVVVLKVYVNGKLLLTSNNARYTTTLGTSNLANTHTIKRCAYTVSEALKLTFEAKQYVRTASSVESKNVVDAEYSVTTPNTTKVWNGVAGNVPFVALWDHDNLFFLLEGDVTPVSIVVDGEELPLTNKVLTAGGNTLITVDKAFTDAVYGQIHKLSVTSATGTWIGAMRIVPTQPHTEVLNQVEGSSNWLASQTAQLAADSDNSLATLIAGNRATGEGAVVKFDNPGGVYFYDQGVAADGVATGKGWNNTFVALYQRRNAAALSSTADKVLTVNVAIEELASIESLTTQEWYTASTPAMLNFVVSDAVTTTKAGLYFALYNLNGVLTLGVNTTANGIVAFPIGAMEDCTNLNLRVEFSDPTPTSVSSSDYSKLDATFYVNGYYVGTVENAKKIGCGNSFLQGAVMYRAVSSTPGQRVAATVSDLCIDTEVNTTMPEVHTHVFGDPVVVEPNCKKDGSSTISCECGEAIVTVLPATDEHSFVYEWDETHHWLECEFCDLEKDGVHSEHTATDSNCEDGLFCDDCGYEILSAGDHEYGEFEVITEATCTTDGLKRAKCTRCDSWKDEVIPATGHSYDEGVVTTEPTCGKDGVMTYTCACGDSYTEVIPATGEHVYGEGVVTTEPTCTVDGVMTFTCECGHSYTEAIPATGEHVYYAEGVVTKDPTCTTPGEATYYCDCGAFYTEEIPATGHTHEVTTQDATCTEDGLNTYTCACGDSYTEVIPATGHNYVDGTCENCGEAEPVVEITNGLVFKDGTYYYLKNGVPKTGDVNVTNVNGLDFATGWYKFDADGRIYNGFFVDGNSTYFYENGKKVKEKMVYVADGENAGYYYIQSNGLLAKNKDIEITTGLLEGFAPGWYKIGSEGKLYTGFVANEYGAKMFYRNGQKVKNQMVEWEGEIYYVRANYTITKKDTEITSGLLEGFAPGWYKFDSEGRLYTGFFANEYGAKMFYRNGKKVKNQMIEWEGEIYYVRANYTITKKDTEITSGLLEGFAPGWYKFDSEGRLYTGFFTNEYGAKMFYRNGKKVKNQMVEWEGEIYYVKANYIITKKDTEITSGLLEGFAPGWYKFDSEGRLYTGFFTDENGAKMFYCNGKKVKNQMVEWEGNIYYIRSNYLVGQSSIKLYEITNTLSGYEAGWYLVDTDGKLFNGEYSGKTYVNGRPVA